MPDWLHRHYGIVGAAGRVDLALAQFRVSATDLRFAAGDQGAAPGRAPSPSS